MHCHMNIKKKIVQSFPSSNEYQINERMNEWIGHVILWKAGSELLDCMVL